MNTRTSKAILLAALILLAASPALAQLARPFAVGATEGGGAATGITGWLMAMQAQLNGLIRGAVKALHEDPSAAFNLAGLSFAYGVFHAAGPGHGKALIATYMLANERALRRGIVLAFLAAALQAGIAISIVGLAALVFHATSQRMNEAAHALELASYAGIAAIGAWLAIAKGTALAGAIRNMRSEAAVFAASTLATGMQWRPALRAGGSFRFRAASPGFDVSAQAECGHIHAPDPATLGDNFSWRTAASTVAAAGARPCSGAILVLVFALAQGVFLAGIGATLAMAMGTAITTGALACLAVFAKRAAMRFVAAESPFAAIVARSVEVLAALAVLALGLAMLWGASGGG